MAGANRATRRAQASNTPPNPHRGEAEVRGHDGKTYKLKLTMNAMVEIEERFGCSIAEVAKRLKADPSMKDLRAFLGPLVRGGGVELTDEEVGAVVDIRDVGRGIANVMAANFTPDERDEEAAERSGPNA